MEVAPAAPPRPCWAWAALVALVAVTLLGLVVRDRLPLLSTLVYATPLPVLAAASGAVAAIARRKGLLRPALAGLALSAALLSAHLVRDLHLAAPASARAGSMRLVLWNVSRGAFGWDDALRDLAACDADVIGLVEARSATPENGAALRAALPSHTVFLVEGGLALAVRGHLPGVVPRARVVRAGRRAPRARARAARTGPSAARRRAATGRRSAPRPGPPRPRCGPARGGSARPGSGGRR